VLDDLFFYLLVVGGPACAGVMVRDRSTQVRELRRLAGLLELQREEAARAAELRERNRVEIGLHRGFSEQIAAIVMRVEGAVGSSPEDMAHALADVEAASRHTLEELRRALGTLRDGTPAAGSDPVTSPVPDPPPPGIDWRDAALALTCGAAVAVETVVSPSTVGPVVANVLVGLVVTSPLALRRARPVLAAVALLVGVAAMSRWLTPWTVMVTTLLPILLAAYSVGAHARSWHRYAGLAVVLTGPAAIMAAVPATAREPGGVPPTMIWLALAFGAGLVAAGWSRRAREQRHVVAELERGHDVHVQRAVEEQRSRLARELHDTLAHSMTVICLQASGGQVRGTATEDTARTILSAARAGLVELRHGLDQLDQRGALEPEEIRSRARAAGLRPEVRVAGDLEALPGQTTALAGRLVREALVNAGRYAPGSRVVVTIDAGDDLRIEIANAAGSGPQFDHGAGTGLRALTEQVARSGGVLEAGPHPDGGWRVSATLPRQEVLA
jgi:signal transduction histidine kinase